eukprot:1148183-Pelagomonas_calceolata.AAC.2
MSHTCTLGKSCWVAQDALPSSQSRHSRRTALHGRKEIGWSPGGARATGKAKSRYVLGAESGEFLLLSTFPYGCLTHINFSLTAGSWGSPSNMLEEKVDPRKRWMQNSDGDGGGGSGSGEHARLL